MIASAHIAAGFVAGMAAGHATKHRVWRLAVAIVLGVVSHVLLDAIPHSDYAGLSRSSQRAVVSLEIVVAGVIGLHILRRRLLPHWPEYLLAGLFGAVIPDVKFIAAILLSDRYARQVEYYGDGFHNGFHAGPTSLAVGMTTQLVCAIVLLACLYAFPEERTAKGDER